MYKKLFVFLTLTVLSACSGNSRNDDLQLAAEDNYTQASTLVSKAKSYKLDINDANVKLTQAGVLLQKEQYNESIISSQAAASLATGVIDKYEQAQADYTELEKFKAATLVKREEQRLATEAARLSASTRKHVVQAGENLWLIAYASKELDYDPYLWPLIFSNNQAVIDDPDLLTPGMVLAIKKTTEASQLIKARNHAQKRGNWRLGTREDSDVFYLQQ